MSRKKRNPPTNPVQLSSHRDGIRTPDGWEKVLGLYVNPAGDHDLTFPIGSVLEYSCPECGGRLILRNSKFGLFYGCENYPICKETHGAHPDGKPLGIPANHETRLARIQAHADFDRIWKDGYMTRKQAYSWLSRKFVKKMSRGKDGQEFAQVHIGSMDIPSCELVSKWSIRFIQSQKKIAR